MNHVLAVTCAQWPDNLVLDADGPSADMRPLEEIAAESIQFHTHYLQRQNGELFPAITPEQNCVEVDRLQQLDTLASRLASLADSEHGQLLHVRIVSQPESDLTGDLLTGTLSAVRRFLNEQEKAADEWLMMITANAANAVSAGGDRAQDRQLSPVPLWLRLPRREAGHVGGLTGSDDLAPTVEEWLGRAHTLVEPAAAVIDSTDAGRPRQALDGPRMTGGDAYVADPVSLLRLMDQPVLSEHRRLLIHGDSVTAARDSEFLLVCPHEASPDSGQLSLFRKPDDVWNLHDVSQQCPEIVEEMTAWLDAMPKE